MFTFKNKTPVIPFDLVYDNDECGARWKAKVGDYDIGLVRRPGKPGKSGYIAMLDGPMPVPPLGTPDVPFDPQFATITYQAPDDATAQRMAAAEIMSYMAASVKYWQTFYVETLAAMLANLEWVLPTALKD